MASRFQACPSFLAALRWSARSRQPCSAMTNPLRDPQEAQRACPPRPPHPTAREGTSRAPNSGRAPTDLQSNDWALPWKLETPVSIHVFTPMFTHAARFILTFFRRRRRRCCCKEEDARCAVRFGTGREGRVGIHRFHTPGGRTYTRWRAVVEQARPPAPLDQVGGIQERGRGDFFSLGRPAVW